MGSTASTLPSISLLVPLLHIGSCDQHAYLTPNKLEDSGAVITALADDTACEAPDSDESSCWTLVADTPGNRNFHLKLSLDDSWAFQSSGNTTLRIELMFHCEAALNFVSSDLVVAFTRSDTDQYFANLVTMGSSTNDADDMYPQCSASPPSSPYANGDPESLVGVYSTSKETRWQKLTADGGIDDDDDAASTVHECTSTFSQKNTLMLTLSNHPATNHMTYSFKKPDAEEVECYFAASRGISDIYFAMNDYYGQKDLLNIVYFSVFKEYREDESNGSPTRSTTQNPQHSESSTVVGQQPIKSDNEATNHGALTTVIVFLAVLLALTLCGIAAYWAHRREVMKTMKQVVRTMSYHPNQVGFEQDTPNGEFERDGNPRRGHHQQVGDNESSPEPSLMKAAPQHVMTTNGLMITKTGDSSEDDDARSDVDEDDDHTIASLTTPYNGTFGSRTPMGSTDGLSLGLQSGGMTMTNLTNFGTQSLGISEMNQFAQRSYGNTAGSGGDFYPKVSEITIDVDGQQVESGVVPVNKRQYNVPYTNITKKQFKMLQAAIKKCRTPSDFQRLGSIVKSGQVPHHEVDDDDEDEDDDAHDDFDDETVNINMPMPHGRGAVQGHYAMHSHEVDSEDDDDDDHHQMHQMHHMQQGQPMQPMQHDQYDHRQYDEHPDHSDPDLSESGNGHRTRQGLVSATRKDTEDTTRSNQRRESSLDKEDLSNRLEVLAKLEPLPALRDNLHQSRLQNGY